MLTGAAGVVEHFISGASCQQVRSGYAFDATEERLRFSVREPFVSRTSSAELTFGDIFKGETLEIISQMPQGGVIFSDGVESDFLHFDSGSITSIAVAEKKVALVSRP